jgi:tripartite ATP-independent transporter DctM subunit
VPGVIFATASNIPVGDIYFGLFIPGFGLAACYVLYITIRCYLQPGYGPALPPSERVSWKAKFIALRGVVLPALIIFAVLGGIYSGVVTPTEAAGIGAFLVLLVALGRRRLNLSRLFSALTSTYKLSTMIVWIIICVSAFVTVFNGLGGSKLVGNAALSIAEHSGGMTVVIIMLLTIIVAGMFMDDLAVILMLGPIYVPVIKSLGFDPLWFGVLFLILMQTAWVSPPYGFALFITRAITPPEIRTTEIWRAVLPFIGCQMVILVLVLLFPAVVQWIPDLVLRR